jgi:uncharacterized protein YozE (UPF0346 family)
MLEMSWQIANWDLITLEEAIELCEKGYHFVSGVLDGVGHYYHTLEVFDERFQELHDLLTEYIEEYHHKSFWVLLAIHTYQENYENVMKRIEK